MRTEPHKGLCFFTMNRNDITIMMVMALVVCVIMGGATIIAGVAMGVAAAISLWISYQGSPAIIQRFIVRFHYLVDIAIGVAIFAMMGAGGTVTGIVAAITTDLLVTMLLKSEVKNGEQVLGARRDSTGNGRNDWERATLDRRRLHVLATLKKYEKTPFGG